MLQQQRAVAVLAWLILRPAAAVTLLVRSVRSWLVIAHGSPCTTICARQADQGRPATQAETLRHFQTQQPAN